VDLHRDSRSDCLNSLKEYLNRFDFDLEQKGIAPDYLAYVIISKVEESLGVPAPNPMNN